MASLYSGRSHLVKNSFFSVERRLQTPASCRELWLRGREVEEEGKKKVTAGEGG